MKNAVLLASLLVLAGCTSPARPTSEGDPIAGKQSSTPAAAATADPQQERTEVPHGNPKMYGPPGY
jgi:PBP1b-binding outer membrane lipoprotein LpoB